jgi:hypothetical protein
MRLDLHTHTRHSPDSRVNPRELVALARRAGLDGVAITDHNATGALRESQDAAEPGFLVVPATEVTSRDGHVLAYGIREAVPRDLSAPETVERIVALGGVAVAAHPYRFWSGLGPEATAGARFAAYETRNARTLRRGNERARDLARAKRVGETGGSDSHFLDEIGGAVTVIDSGALGLEGVLQALGQGRTSAEGRDRGAAATARYVTKCVTEWLARGMRRI